jgi:Tfp pilus assembly protein PilN
LKINLLPPELRERQRGRRRVIGVSVVGGIIVVLLAAFYVVQQVRLSGVQDDLDQQQATNAGLQQQIADLQSFEDLQAELESEQALLQGLLINEVLWSGVLRDVSLVIPGEAWLEGLTGTITAEPVPGEEAVAEPPPQGLIGQITFTGLTFDHPTVALWLSRLAEVEGFANPWLSVAEREEAEQAGQDPLIRFDTSVDLSEDAAVTWESP